MSTLELDGIFSEGYGIIAKKVMKDNRLSTTSKAIYAYLCSYSGKGKTSFPSQSLICFDLNLSKSTLAKYIKELKDLGYIEVRQIKKDGKFSKNEYYLKTTPYSKFQYTETSVSVNSVNGKSNTNNNSINNNNSFNNNKPIKEIHKETEIEEIYNIFSQICTSLPKPKKLTDTRNKAIKSRLKEYGKETIIEVFQKTNNSDFLSGRNSEWIASFDWIMKSANFVKILEDTYVNKSKPNNSKIYGKGKEQEYLDSIGEW